MEIKEAEFNRTDLQAVEEQIYDINSKMKRDAFELGKVEFHNKYLEQRKEFINTTVTSRTLLIAPITFFVLFVFIGLSLDLETWEDGSFFATWVDIVTGNPVLTILLVLLSIAGAFFDAFLLGDLIKLSRCCRNFATIEQANAYCEHRHVITLQKDEYDTQQSLLLLRSRIEYAEKKLACLRKDRDVLVEEKKRQEALEREQRRRDGGFVLNPNAFEDLNRESAIESYTYEINILTKNISEYERELLFLDRRKQEVDDAYGKAVTQAKASGIAFVVLVCLQQIFFSKGTVSVFVVIALAVFSLVAAFVLENKLEKPILDYLVEQDCPYIKSYMFCNNLIPIYKQKKRYAESP